MAQNEVARATMDKCKELDQESMGRWTAMSDQEKLDAANRLMYPPSEPRATIEVQLARNINGEVVIGGPDSCSRVYPHHNVKPLNPECEAVLNPKNGLEEIAKRLYIASCMNRGTDPCWDSEQPWIKACFLAEAREVCRMEAEELRRAYDKPTQHLERIAELEEQANEPA